VLRKLLLLSLFLPFSLAAQDVSQRYQAQVIGSRGLPLANQSVAVCTQPAVTTTQPCSPLATLGTSTTTSSGGPNPLTTDVNGNFFFYATPGKYTIQIYGPQVGTPFVQPDTPIGLAVGGTVTTLTVTGALNANGTFNGVATVSPSGPVTIQAALNSVGANGVVWLAPGAYNLSSTLTLNNAGVSLRCMGSTSIFDSVCRITQPNSTNLAPMISMTGAQASMTDIVVDGNGTNNPTGTDNIFINGAPNSTLEHVTSLNAQRHNVNCFGSSTIFLSRLYAQASVNGDNVLMNQCADSRLINGSSLQNAGQYGLELLNNPTLRTDGTPEVAGSTLDDVFVHGTFPCPSTAGAGCSNNNHLEFSQLANAKNNELRMVCYDTVGGGYVAWGNMITFQSFGSGNLSANNTYSQIVLQDCDANIIKAVMLDSKTAPNQQKFAISATETAGGRSLGNNCILGVTTHSLGSYGTSFYSDTTTGGAFGCQMPIRGGGASSSFDLFDVTTSAATPHKYLRVSSGLFTITNSAFSTNIFQVDDTGNGFFNSGVFSSTIGNIGGAGNPWGNIFLGTAATNNFKFQPAATAAARTVSIPDPGTNVNLGFNLRATSAAFATATTAGTCVQNTTAVAGATTSMVAKVSPVSTPGVGAQWSALVSSAGNVTITECAVATSAGGTIAFNIEVTP